MAAVVTGESQTDRQPSQPNSPGSTTAARPPSPKRKPSVRFHEGAVENNTRSVMSKRGGSQDSDDTTPIKAAESVTGRIYNTQLPEQPLESTSAQSSPPATSQPTPLLSSTEEEGKKPSWYKRVAEKYGSVYLENKGSVARDHLALERTFLAWLRTSLAFASIGIAVTQLFRLNTNLAPRSQDLNSTAAATRSGSDLPFAPMLGQSIPIELLPYLQQALATAVPAVPRLGPTLLDQLLLLPPSGTDRSNSPLLGVYPQSGFDEHAAARLRHVGKPLGATFLGISIAILVIGFHRYFESQHWIIRGKFPASRGSVFLVGFMAAALIITSLVVVIVVAPRSYEKK